MKSSNCLGIVEALLGLQYDEEFVPAYEMEDAENSDAEEMGGDSNAEFDNE